jgi:hypothetical protein
VRHHPASLIPVGLAVKARAPSRIDVAPGKGIDGLGRILVGRLQPFAFERAGAGAEPRDRERSSQVLTLRHSYSTLVGTAFDGVFLK